MKNETTLFLTEKELVKSKNYKSYLIDRKNLQEFVPDLSLARVLIETDLLPEDRIFFKEGGWSFVIHRKINNGEEIIICGKYFPSDINMDDRFILVLRKEGKHAFKKVALFYGKDFMGLLKAPVNNLEMISVACCFECDGGFSLYSIKNGRNDIYYLDDSDWALCLPGIAIFTNKFYEAGIKAFKKKDYQETYLELKRFLKYVEEVLEVWRNERPSCQQDNFEIMYPNYKEELNKYMEMKRKAVEIIGHIEKIKINDSDMKLEN